MENYEGLLIVLLSIGGVLGIGLSVVYYFARYSIKTDYDRDVEAATAATGEAAPATAKTEAEALPLQRDLKTALKTTRQTVWGRISNLLGNGKVPDQILEEIEEILFTSDLGVPTVQRLMNAVETNLKGQEKADPEAVRQALRSEMLEIFGSVPGTARSENSPTVWLIVGVNGAGKTTTIGKLAAANARQGKKVLVAAGDTFRAAAGEQLKVWTDRAQSGVTAAHAGSTREHASPTGGQVEIFSPPNVTDPAAVAYEACQKAKAANFDLILIDTAGRLHTQKNLMEELKKVKRVLAKVLPTAPDETFLVLDANSGQNALQQAREFHGALDVTGVILTKMDGTAKGGVALGLASELKIPVRLIGIGEGLNDLRPFDATEYVHAIL